MGQEIEFVTPDGWLVKMSVAALIKLIGAVTGGLAEYQRRRSAGDTHETARERVVLLQDWGAPKTLAMLAIDAYARGMERPTMLGRPGVKGGISTCDMRDDYE